MLKLILVMMLGWSIGLAWSDEPDVTLFIDGVEVDIPDNRQVIMVPSHWALEDIYRESHRAESIMLLSPSTPSCADMEDELVVGGAICIP